MFFLAAWWHTLARVRCGFRVLGDWAEWGAFRWMKRGIEQKVRDDLLHQRDDLLHQCEVRGEERKVGSMRRREFFADCYLLFGYEVMARVCPMRLPNWRDVAASSKYRDWFDAGGTGFGRRPQDGGACT